MKTNTMIQTTEAIFISDSSERSRALTELGLPEKNLHDLLHIILGEFRETIPNDAIGAGGQRAYLIAVRMGREIFKPSGWIPETSGQIELIKNPKNGVTISFSSGNKYTGMELPPRGYLQKNSFGAHSQKLVMENGGQLDLFNTNSKNSKKTEHWMFLYYFDQQKEEIRAELILPLKVDRKNKIESWEKRIILDAIPFSMIPDAAKRHINLTEDIDIEIQRKPS